MDKSRKNKIHKTQENWEEWRNPNEKKNTEQEKLEHSKPDKKSPITKLKIKLKQPTLKEDFNKTPTQVNPSTSPPPLKNTIEPAPKPVNNSPNPGIQSSNPKAITQQDNSNNKPIGNNPTRQEKTRIGTNKVEEITKAFTNKIKQQKKLEEIEKIKKEKTTKKVHNKNEKEPQKTKITSFFHTKITETERETEQQDSTIQKTRITPIKTNTPNKIKITSTRINNKKKNQKQEEINAKKARGYWLKLAEENKKSKDESTVIAAQDQVHCNLAIRGPSTLNNTDGRILEHSIPSNPARITKNCGKNNESEITLGTDNRIWDRGIKSLR